MTNALNITPNIEALIRLMHGDRLQPIVGTSDGMLLGQIRDLNRNIWVLSDPDVISNYGLARSGNAALAVAIIERLRSGSGSVVFDETIHGFIAQPANPLLLLFRFPFVMATIQGAIAIALLLWATLGRFGTPQPAPTALSAGRQGLLENIAKLVDITGHREVMIKRYVLETLRDVGRQLHAPRGLSTAGLIGWLQRVGTARNVATDCGPLIAEAAMLGESRMRNPASLVRLAREIDRWKGEILMDVQDIRAIADGMRGEIRKAVVGQDEVIDLMLTSLLAGGHILLEGVPGTAKTLITRAFAASLALQFGRIQFTPDLMPGDVLGTNLFNFQTNSFLLTKGPIFTQLLLADEINRTPPKTQAALLQAMNEHVVTIDGKDYELGDDFMVVATQNPIEQQGTYPLPEAQLDRFLFKINIDHPSRDEERDIVRRHGHRSAMPRLEDFDIAPVADSATLAAVREAVTYVRLSEPLIDYIVDMIRATREHSSLEVGASTRAANMLASAVRAFAVLQGRNFVIPDDIKVLALPVLRHRVTMSPSAEIEGLSADRILREVLDQTPAPR